MTELGTWHWNWWQYVLVIFIGLAAILAAVVPTLMAKCMVCDQPIFKFRGTWRHYRGAHSIGPEGHCATHKGGDS